jgi:ankyrin repeat protein
LKLQAGQQIVGFGPLSDPNSELGPSDVEAHCSNFAVEWISFNEMKDGQPNEAARILHFRSRLAYLTGDPITPPRQEWDTDIRKMAAQLQEALQESAEYVFSGDMELSGDWKDVKALLWSTTCQLPELSNESRGLPIHFLMYRNNSRWKINKDQLEATLGLWWWSLKQGDGQPNLFTEKIMLVEESKKMEYKSVIRLWITQTHTAVSERAIRLPHLMPINSSGFHEVSTSQPGKLYHPTTLSVSTKALLGPQNSIRDVPGAESGSGVLLAMETRSSPLQIIAQDIFTIFISRVADVLEPLKEAAPRQTQVVTTNPLRHPQERPYLGLINTHIQSISDKLVAAGIGSREDALWSIIPPLLQRSKLPHLDDVMEDLLSSAKSLRRASKFQVGEDLLKTLFHLGPPQFHDRVIRALGGVYRAALRSQKQLDQDFGRGGLKKMRETCDMPKLSEQAKQTLSHFESVLNYFEGNGISNRTGQNLQILDCEPPKSFQDLIGQPAHPYGLVLTDEIDFSKESTVDHQNILEWAIQKNCPELVEDLWTVDRTLIHQKNLQGLTPIFWALEISSEAEAFECLLEWPDVLLNSYESGETALLFAAKKGRYKAVQCLLKRGADTRAKNQQGRTPLSIAVENGHFEVVELLVQTGEDLIMLLQSGRHASDFAEQVILPAAAFVGGIETIRLLIQKARVNVNMPLCCGGFGTAFAAAAYSDYGSALAAAAYKRKTEMVKFLVQEAGAKVNMPLEHGRYGSALAAAAYGGEIEIVKFLVQEAGAEVNTPLEHGNYGSALAAAAFGREIEIVKFLVQKAGAEVNTPLEHGDYGSALVAAAFGRETEIVKFLVQEAGAEVNMPLEHGKFGSALAAAYMGEIEIVKFLVQKAGAEVNMPLEHGNYGSALAAAAYGGEIEIVKFLVQKAGAEVNMPLEHGDYGNALAAARYREQTEIVKFLVQEAGARGEYAASG